MKRNICLFSFILLILLYPVLNAQTWSSPIRLTWNTGMSTLPKVAVSPDNVIHVVWMDNTPGNKEVFYKRSTDAGTSWSPLTRLTWFSDDATTLALTTDSSNRVHVAWSNVSSGNIEVFYKRSLDSGLTWQAPQRLTWNAGVSKDVAVCSGPGGSVYIVWADGTPGSNEIFYKKSTNSGSTWSTINRLTWKLYAANSPAVIHDNSNVLHIVWEDFSAGNFELFHKRSTNGGTSWEAPKRLTWTSGTSADACLAVNSGSGFFITYHDNTPSHFEIYFKRSMDRGITWSAVQRLTWNAANTQNPSITVDSINDIHCVWESMSPVAYTDLYYKSSSDNGNTWTLVKRLTYSSGASTNPFVAVDSNDVLHLVWSETSPGNWEIYYKKKSRITVPAVD